MINTLLLNAGKITYWTAFLFRLLMSYWVLHVAHQALQIATPFNSLVFALCLGHLTGSILSFSSLRGWVVPSLIALVFLLANTSFHYILAPLIDGSAKDILSPYSILLDTNLVFVVFGLSYVSTWLYWRVHHYATLEILLLLLGFLSYFAPHRDMQLANAPRLIHALAWQLHTSSFALIILFGGLASLLVSLYFGLASHAMRPEASPIQHQTQTVRGSHRPLMLLIFSVLGLGIIGLSTRLVYNQYFEITQSMSANGVGQSKEEALGKSPLGFHSALGSNNQPAALVRLDGDYSENPFTPMLYLREGALSQLDGQELVNAGKAYDDDVTHSGPGKSYLTNERIELVERVPVTQTIYLLSDHEVSFGIDYPVSVTPLENPAPNRFSGAFKVYSVAPTHSIETLTIANVGSPDWEKQKLQHYLELHNDKRYANLAHSITQDIPNKALQAKALADYLSKNAIYTLTPNHEMGIDDDPVAPFLFGDMRGYCVHFAHATVYMLRALGIPARIGTGYLTDLSQSKDGHILLRMSDRHAWAEAYFEGYGWIPFDTQPEQVESHADTEVDVNLLEELMGLVGIDKELLPPDETLEEIGLRKEEGTTLELPPLSVFVNALIGGLVMFIFFKLFLWFGFLIPSSSANKLSRGFASLQARLIDLGFPRHYGETVEEYVARLDSKEKKEANLRHTWNIFRAAKYRRTWPHQTVVTENIKEDLHSISKIPLFRRIIAFFNPASLYKSISW